MLFRALELVRYAALLLLLIFLFPASPVLAASDMVWSFSEGNDASNRGRMTARLGYGVPETDNVQVDGVCEARRGTSVMSANLILGADVGKLEDGSNVNVRFTGGGFNHFVSGSVYGTKLEEGITGISLDVNVKDPLWKALTEQDSLDYLVPGYSASKLALKGGHDKIRQFIRACRAYADELGPGKSAKAAPKPEKTAEAKPAKKEQPAKAEEPKKKKTASGGALAKEAFDGAKELGTVEAWEAFLNNFPKGFRADLARAYVKRLGAASPSRKASPPPAPPPPPPPAVVAAPPPPPPGPADISITQTANQAACKGGDSCSYTMVATNTGGTTFTGQLVIANSLAPRGSTLTSPGNAPWFCQGMGGGAVCTNPAADLAPGASTNLSLTFTLPRGAGGSVTSCASISWGGAPTGSSVRDVQAALNAQGFNVGRPDGKAGRKTRKAIRDHQTRNGLQPSGEIDLPLLISLFTVPAAGDANPGNDQACAGSAVTPAPSVFTPAPPPVSRWQPPRGQKAVTRKGRPGKCSSRSVWLEGQCILKSAVASYCGPGYHRERSKCVSNANRATAAPRGGQQAGCPSGQLQIGNNCVNINLAPLFGKLKKSGQGGGAVQRPGANVKTFTAPNVRPPVTAPNVPPPVIKQKTQKPPTPLGGGKITQKPKSTLSYEQVNAQIYSDCQSFGLSDCQALADRRTQAVLNSSDPAKTLIQSKQELKYHATPNKKPPAMTCSRGQAMKIGKRVLCKCPANRPNACKSDGVTYCKAAPCGQTQKKPVTAPVKKTKNNQRICAAGEVGKCTCPAGKAKGQGNAEHLAKCLPLCPAGLARVYGICCPPRSLPNKAGICMTYKKGILVGPAKMPSQVKQQTQQKPKIACSGGGKVINGRCVCPSNRPRLENGKCKKPKGNQIIQQLQQPQQQPQTQQKPKIACAGGGRVINGRCVCPSNRPRLENGKCKKPKGNQIIQQLQQQPQNQPQPQQPQQPQNQQQQQLQQGINNLLKQFSDARLKRDVTHIATLSSGIRLYAFRYLWEDTLRVGVMAQDLLGDPRTHDAVSLHPSGYYMVDYGQLGLRMVTLEEWRAGGAASVLHRIAFTTPANQAGKRTGR